MWNYKLKIATLIARISYYSIHNTQYLTYFVLILWELDSINMKYVWNCASPPNNRYSVSASVIYDLLLVKSKLADVFVLSSTDVDFIIDTLCVS